MSLLGYHAEPDTGADALQPALVPRFGFRARLRPDLRRQGSICGWLYDGIRGGSQRSALDKPVAGSLLDACIAKGVALFLPRPRGGTCTVRNVILCP
jgi:hypothetical protein